MMSDSQHEHGATVRWTRRGERFVDQRYSRAHVWSFDGGAEIHASASPANVPRGTADPAGVDPEEGFLASLASCHMLWFLSIAAERGFLVDGYEDSPTGTIVPLAEDAARKVFGRIVLRPAVTFDPSTPCTRAQLDALHEEAHRQCFLANALGPAALLTIEPRDA